MSRHRTKDLVTHTYVLGRNRTDDLRINSQNLTTRLSGYTISIEALKKCTNTISPFF